MKASRCSILILLTGLFISLSTSLYSWGFEAHKLINRKAVELLPGSLGESFKNNIDFISEHSIDPDLWRMEGNDPDEAHGHYIDADLYEDFPFDGIPRDRKLADEKFGEENLLAWGTAPWRIEEYVNRLADHLRSGNWEDVPLTAAVLGHYVSDIHMPLHVVENYNGQLSGNTGIHKRWEADMVNRYLLGAIYPKGVLNNYNDPVEMAFTIVKESYPLHFELLRADSLARSGLTNEQQDLIPNRDASMNGTGYIEILYSETGQIAKKRMEDAAVRVASYWLMAWEAAGSPLPLIQYSKDNKR